MRAIYTGPDGWKRLINGVSYDLVDAKNHNCRVCVKASGPVNAAKGPKMVNGVTCPFDSYVTFFESWKFVEWSDEP